MNDKEKVIAKLTGKPMCPKCNEEISQLSYNSKVDVGQDFSVDDKGSSYYSSFDDYGEHSDDEYACPNCNNVLFTDEDKALNFLKGRG